MSQNLVQHLSSEEQDQLFDDLYQLSMGQLRNLCDHFGLSKTGKKVFLIESLKQYLLTGSRLEHVPLPAISCAQKGQLNELHPDVRILSGFYRNDLKTRLFMKSLVGDHFHFTAAGIDWIRACWEQGKPPMYREFAVWWQAEYAAKDTQRSLKKEWAFLNFVRSYQAAHPDASKAESMKEWKDHQAETAARVMLLLRVD